MGCSFAPIVSVSARVVSEVPPIRAPLAAATMADSLVDLGLQDALRYVHVNILPSIVLVTRDVAHVVVVAVACVLFAWDLASSSPSVLGAAWIFAKAFAALLAFQLVFARVVDPFVYAKTREYVDLGKRRHVNADAGTRAVAGGFAGSLFSPPGSRAPGSRPTTTLEDPLAAKRAARSAAAIAAHGTPAGTPARIGGGVPGLDPAAADRSPGSPTAFAPPACLPGPRCSAGLRAASSPGARGLPMGALRDGARVCVEIRGGDGSDGWSEGFLCVHPHKTYETTGAMGALQWGGHQIVAASRAATAAMCRGETLILGAGGRESNGGGGKENVRDLANALGGPRLLASPESHERDAARFVFKLHLFGSGRDATLRSESTGTLVTTFVTGVRFERRRVVAWHRQRSSKLLTAGVSMFTPPEGGAWEEFALQPVRRSASSGALEPDEGEDAATEFAVCRPREMTFWKHDAGGDGMLAFTRDLSEASVFRLHDADGGEFGGEQDKWE